MSSDKTQISVGATEESHDVPYDEDLAPTLLPHVEFQTLEPMRALASSSVETVEIQSRNPRKKLRGPHSWETEESVADQSATTTSCTTTNNCMADNSAGGEAVSGYPVPPGFQPESVTCPQLVPRSVQSRAGTIRSLGPPYLQIYRFSLPEPMLPLLCKAKEACDDHASRLATGWKTHLYSLTKNDIAVNDIPSARQVVLPITDLVLSTIQQLWGRPVHLDWNQPHMLKYDGNHKSVPLHHDLCDVTVNIMVSERRDYIGGGTYLPAIGTTVYLDYGECLIHPGTMLHAGGEIRFGNRYLLIYFAKF